MQPPQAMNGMTGHGHHLGHGAGNVFGAVMGNGPGQLPTVPQGGAGLANARVYASVYSGVSRIKQVSIQYEWADGGRYRFSKR